MIICAGRNETFKFAEPMGVGLIEMSINLTRKCLFDKPDFILFVGSAGSYGEHNIFDIIESKRAANIELSFLQNNSYTPLDNVLESENKFVRNDTIVNSSNYISSNFSLSKKFNAYGIGVENMEFFAVLQVAKEFEIPVGGIFVVTNYTNETAHEDFLKNHKEAMSKLTNSLIEKNIIK
ncbi:MULTISPECIES: purine-nucleoside phosphorylase [Malaciobacter]|jgi:nucleoside phosphorylase|uniref:Nucleoside phosphorylase n=2 Tax=Malaciobacter TaxID=2321114 RepID=A0AB36ZY64_9BACT|nr:MULTISPECIES: purine-nucleoside phosphorylase [Malaciobacter]PHO09522.1 purine-nucleoside phosphorylase [Malaciobacter canalis]PPK61366.1 nucleoside phosphorylase [Malaciobacter marinus]QEE31584.1 putative nucleoside phosphorylase [Malaciobacter canalis]SKB45307.1 Nucleoside phosphorylase [Malaciobacter marinus]